MADDPFEGPKSLCRWAREEIDQFEAAEKAFFEANPGTKTEHLNYMTGEVTHKLVFPEEPPETLRRSAYRIVNDLRNTLDQAIYAASKVLRAPRLKYIAFPFGENADDFDKALARTGKRAPYQDIPTALHPILKSFKPYHSVNGGDDGNDLLRSLARVANPNKHIVPLSIVVGGAARFYGGMGHITSIGNRQPAKNEVELYRTVFGRPFHIDYRPEPSLALPDAGHLSGKPALASFRQLHAIVDGIVLGLEAETRRLRGD